jgi:Dyp-type peroxidase family
MAATLLKGRTAGVVIEKERIQGLVASGYGHLPHAAYLLLAVADPVGARAWLGSVVGDVTPSAGKGNGPNLNVAFTWPGLQAIGLRADALATFPPAVQEGLATARRARILGDTDDSAPEAWRWGGPNTPEIHVLLMVFAQTEEALAAECERHRAAFSAGAGPALREVAEPIFASLPEDRREHFGFTDGISHPSMRGWGNEPQGEAAKWAVVEPGEFLLGYPDNYLRPVDGPTVAAGTDPGDELPPAPGPAGRRDLGRNGSYLVARQLAQDVPAFRRFLAGAAGDDVARQRLAAELVGRWPSGAPLVRAPEHDDPALSDENDFGYHDEDQQGLRCPLGAHIRRANPRDSSPRHPVEGLRSVNNHRLLRRGRPFGLPLADPPTRPGEEESAERGMIFLCLNGDIERQFEFVQHTWLNNPSFADLLGEVDPIASNPGPGGGRFSEQQEPVRRRIDSLPRFVTVRGGAYFFLPGLPALRYLSRLGGEHQ